MFTHAATDMTAKDAVFGAAAVVRAVSSSQSGGGGSSGVCIRGM